ncbi:MAG: GspE/PulE family protein [Candidatus Hydrogenedentota bacterium]
MKALENVAPKPNERIAFAELQAQLDGTLAQGDNGVVEAVHLMLAQAVLHRASDLYCEPWKDGLVIRLRLDGVLHNVARLDQSHQERLIARIKVMANMVTYEKGMPQDGHIEFGQQQLNASMRVSIYPTIYGEKAVIRILDSGNSFPGLDELGFADDVRSGLRSWTARPQGTLLLTGPSASGKTTTIYALLREILDNPKRSRHIVTIEDPVEYRLDGITQSQIQPAQDFTYDVALRAVLRQDPDVLMVGEIRDSETAHAAIKAGLTGHLVVSTIHSSSASGVFSRLLDMGVEPYLLASSITGVLSQRLVRNVCTHCATPHIPDSKQLTRFGLKNARPGFVRGMGCEHCQGIGYDKRSALGEWLSMTPALSESVLQRCPTHLIEQTAIDSGMKTLLKHGLDRVSDGTTTLDELELAIYPEDYER